jgi:predicted CopG family antitoxin
MLASLSTSYGGSYRSGRQVLEGFASTAILVFWSYTEIVLKKMTITISEDVARWVRRKAAEENTSVSKVVGRILENRMRRSDEYWEAYEKVSRIRSILGMHTAHRLSREEAHERR